MVKNATCEPLFNVLSGIGIYFKVQIEPSITLDDHRDFNEFATLLYFVLNERLKQTVSVTICHTSLWHFPRSHFNLVESYIFDVDLFDPEILFSQVLENIHTFFLQINSDSSIMLSTGLVIRLKFKFGHAVRSIRNALFSAMTPTALKLLRKKDRLNFCGVRMTVSDTNWCYRVPLDVRDTIGGVVKQLKHSGKLIYYEQFDYLNPSTILLCMNLLASKETQKKDMTQTTVNIPPDINVYDDNDLHSPWYTTKTAVITYIILAAVVLVTVPRTVRSIVCSDHNNVKTANEISVDGSGELQPDEASAENTDN